MKTATCIALGFLILAGSACTEGGWYRAKAEAKCRDRGLAPATAEFKSCVKELEDAEYAYWFRRLKTVGD